MNHRDALRQRVIAFKTDGGKVPVFVVPGMLCGCCYVIRELERK